MYKSENKQLAKTNNESMKHTTIEFTIDADQVAHVCLNRADTHNALSPLMMRELIEVFTDIAGQEAIRAVVLTGAGRSFCAGGDLKWMQSNLNKTRKLRIAESAILSDLFRCIDQCPKLVIARVNGAAYGGGIGLIAACDIVISIDTASFALTEVRLGLVPANIAPYVIRKIGSARMRRLALNALRFDARQAQSLGLVDLAIEDEALDAAVAEEIRHTLACGPMAIATSKKMIADLERGGLDNPAQYMVETLADVWEGKEAQAGIRAFFAKSSPPWKQENIK